MGFNFNEDDDKILHEILLMVEVKKTEPLLFSETYDTEEIVYSVGIVQGYISKLKSLQETFNIKDSTSRLQNIGTILDYLTVEKPINSLAVLENSTSLTLDLLCNVYNELVTNE